MTAPEVDFDHHSRTYRDDPLGVLAAVRARGPVTRTDSYGGFYILTTHAGVSEVALDPITYSSRHVLGTAFGGANMPPTAYVFMPGELDPPQHTAFKRLMNPFFTRDAAESHRASVQRWTATVIDAMIETGKIDIVYDFANVIAALFTCELVGLPIDSWRSWGAAVHERSYLPPDSERYVEAAAAFSAAVEQVLRYTYERRGNPSNDMLSSVAQATLDGRLLDDAELRSVCTSFLVGGFDTTASLVADMLFHLGHHPELKQRLIDEPGLMPSAVEEYLRYSTPAQGLARTVTTQAEVQGCPLQPEDRVFLSWAAANRDPNEFDRPNEIVLDRSPNRHVAFGAGVHRCIGRHFARMEAEVMVSEFLRRIPTYAIDLEQSQRFPSIGIINGWIRMPAWFAPGRREGEGLLP